MAQASIIYIFIQTNNFLFSLAAEVTFLYSEYGPISIAEKKIIRENNSMIDSTHKR